MIEARLAMMQSILATLVAEELKRWPDPPGKLRTMREERRKMLAGLEEGEDAVTLWREYVLFFDEVAEKLGS